jgi:PilZ domain
LEVEITVRTDNGLFPGRTHDISESGMSAALPVELREGEEVELQINFPKATANTRAIVRHRNIYRHGFEFVQPLHEILRNDEGRSADTLTYFDLSRAIVPRD